MYNIYIYIYVHTHVFFAGISNISPDVHHISLEFRQDIELEHLRAAL